MSHETPYDYDPPRDTDRVYLPQHELTALKAKYRNSKSEVAGTKEQLGAAMIAHLGKEATRYTRMIDSSGLSPASRAAAERQLHATREVTSTIIGILQSPGVKGAADVMDRIADQQQAVYAESNHLPEHLRDPDFRGAYTTRLGSTAMTAAHQVMAEHSAQTPAQQHTSNQPSQF